MTTGQAEIMAIGIGMVLSGLADDFVLRAVALARDGRGARALFAMWRDAADEAERAEIVADLGELLDDAEGPLPPVAPRSHDDVERVAAARVRWKAHLRRLVEAAGGVSDVARRSRIPQPSLSRMLNDLSEPRAATLAKLAEALGVPVGALRDGDEPARRPPARIVPLGPYRARQVFTLTSFRVGRHEACG